MNFAVLIFGVVSILALRWPGLWFPVISYGYTLDQLLGGTSLNRSIVPVAIIATAFHARNSIRSFRLSGIDISLFILLAYYGLAASISWIPDSSLEYYGFTLIVLVSLYILWRLCGLAISLDSFSRQSLLGFLVIGGPMALACIGEVDQSLTVSRAAVGDGSSVGLAQPLPYAAFACTILVFKLQQNPRFPTRILGALSLILVIYWSILNGTRGILIVWIAGLAFFMLSNGSQKSRAKFLALLTIIAISIFSISQTDAVQSIPGLARLLDFGEYGRSYDPSSLERIYRYKSAGSFIEQSPIFGIGPGVFGELTKMDYPHNLFLEVAVDSGLIGLTILAALIFVSARSSINSIQQKHAGAAILATYMLMGFIHQQFSFNIPAIKSLMLIGLLASFENRRFKITPREI